MKIYGLTPLRQSRHLAISGGHCFRASGDTKYSIFYVASQNLVIERSYKFMSGRSSLHATTLSMLVALGIVVK